MSVKACAHCGAQWIDGVHYWSGTGKVGNELDLAGLVCNTPHGDASKCINPALGCPGGDTWAGRAAFIRAMPVGEGADGSVAGA